MYFFKAKIAEPVSVSTQHDKYINFSLTQLFEYSHIQKVLLPSRQMFLAPRAMLLPARQLFLLPRVMLLPARQMFLPPRVML